MFEVEQKYRLKNPGKLRSLLRRLKARKVGSGWEKNELYDLGLALRAQGCVLRLRETSRKAVLTYKGPRLKAAHKKRVEIETPVDLKAAKAMLKQTGFKVVAKYAKTREEYALGGCHVTLDKLKGAGWFSEIEGPSAKIRKFEKILGFTPADREPRNYLQILNS